MMNEDFKPTEASGYSGRIGPENRFKTIYNYIPISFIILVVGIVFGLYFGNMFHQQKVVDSIKLQRFLHKNIVYNITPNVEVSK